MRGDFSESTYPKSDGGLYDPGPGVSLFNLSYIRAAVPKRLVPAFFHCDKT